MKNVSFFSLFAILLIGLSSCKDDKEGTLVLRFRATYDNEPLSTFATKPFISPEQIQFTHMSMLISDLELYKSGSSEVLDEIELVDLSFDNAADAEEGYVMTLTQIPASTYTGIRFGIGVPPDVNQKVPADFPSDHPLSKTGYYWVPWSSYIFSKTEGRLDTLGTGMFDVGFALHTGANELYRILEGPVPLTIEDGKETSLDIVIDYKLLLDGVDIKTNPQNHNPEDSVLIQKIVNNLANSIYLQQ